MKPTSLEDKLSRAAAWLIVAVLVLLPFHAFFTTWAGSDFGHLDLFRIWKELLMVPLALVCLWLLARDQRLLRQLAGNWLVRLSLAYIFFSLAYGLFARWRGGVNTQALLYSWITDLRLVGFMLIVWIITAKNQLVWRHWRPIVLAPAVVVVVFGLLQRLFLPADFLRHFGYGPQTIPDIETVDQKLAYRRIQSTLRGANPFGAYLIVVIIAAAVWLRRWRTQVGLWLLVVASLAAIYLTYSRSAWLGLAAGLAWLIWWRLPNRFWRQAALVAGAGLILLTAGGVWLLRHNDTVQNSLFHTDEHSTSLVSSNAGRSSALRDGLHDVWRQPFGAGPGTAGPASFRNSHPPRIAENYYIQLAQELGLIGLALFVAINLLLARTLWRQRDDRLAQVLLASLIGITIVNMLSHAWADDTLSLLWWGLAGAGLGVWSPVTKKAAPATRPAIMNKRQTKAKTK